MSIKLFHNIFVVDKCRMFIFIVYYPLSFIISNMIHTKMKEKRGVHNSNVS